MLRKLVFLSGVGVGYTLGARAGREQYDRIRSLACNAMSSATGRDCSEHKSGLPAEAEPFAVHAGR